MIEMLVGLQVTNEADYAKYREGMTPILESIGGGFGYDFKVSKVLKSESPNPINRVFTISFPDKNAMDLFFADEKYLKIKEQFFTKSVGSTTIISTYNKF